MKTNWSQILADAFTNRKTLEIQKQISKINNDSVKLKLTIQLVSKELTELENFNYSWINFTITFSNSYTNLLNLGLSVCIPTNSDAHCPIVLDSLAN